MGSEGRGGPRGDVGASIWRRLWWWWQRRSGGGEFCWRGGGLQWFASLELGGWIRLHRIFHFCGVPLATFLYGPLKDQLHGCRTVQMFTRRRVSNDIGKQRIINRRFQLRLEEFMFHFSDTLMAVQKFYQSDEPLHCGTTYFAVKGENSSCTMLVSLNWDRIFLKATSQSSVKLT